MAALGRLAVRMSGLSLAEMRGLPSSWLHLVRSRSAGFHRAGFPWCGAEARGSWAVVVMAHGAVAPRPVGSSRTRGGTCVSSRGKSLSWLLWMVPSGCIEGAGWGAVGEAGPGLPRRARWLPRFCLPAVCSPAVTHSVWTWPAPCLSATEPVFSLLRGRPDFS